MAVKPNWMQRMRSWTGKLRTDDFVTISTFWEKRVFLKNHSIEFLKFGREILQAVVKWTIEKFLKFNRGNLK